MQNPHALSRSLHPLDVLKLRLAHLIAALHLIDRRYYFGRCVACLKVSMITNTDFHTFMWSTFKRMCNLSFLIKVTKPFAILGIRKLRVKMTCYFITCSSFWNLFTSMKLLQWKAYFSLVFLFFFSAFSLSLWKVNHSFDPCPSKWERECYPSASAQILSISS